VAIDSLVLGVPVGRLEREDHGPEFEYLSEETSLILPAGTTPEAFGEALAALLADPDRVARLAAGCRAAAPEYSIDAMVRRFTDGVLAALDAPRR
jgi:glycosyltransferase involved in cell wall biosynthesis